jgi:hypothetical protein
VKLSAFVGRFEGSDRGRGARGLARRGDGTDRTGGGRVRSAERSRAEREKRRSASASTRDDDYRRLQNYFAKNKVGELLGHLLIRDFDENSDDIRIIEKIVDLLGQVRGRRVRRGSDVESGRVDDYRAALDPRRPRLDRFGLEQPGVEEEQR